MAINRILKLVFLAVLVAAPLAAAIVTAQDDAELQAKIENAMSAAPLSIAQDATIMDNEMDEDGSFVVLREGSNGWYCFPDLLSNPGNDPICQDQTWQDFTYAFIAGEEPNVTVPGLTYMLQGGSDASNTDPFAIVPTEGEDWMTTPPHIMILFPGDLDTNVLSTDHLSGGPWIMWAGTPYEHIMMPVAEGEQEH